VKTSLRKLSAPNMTIALAVPSAVLGAHKLRTAGRAVVLGVDIDLWWLGHAAFLSAPRLDPLRVLFDQLAHCYSLALRLILVFDGHFDLGGYAGRSKNKSSASRFQPRHRSC
jgi:hypothetical protein